MSYSLLQDSVDDLRGHNQQVTDKLIAEGGTTTTAEKTALDHRDAAKASRQSTDTLITDTVTERDLAQTAETAAQADQTAAGTARDTAQAQPALAQTEVARAVSAANAAEITALGAHSGLASVASEHIRPSLVLDFANQEYWKQGAYPWLKETLDPAVDLTFTRGSTATYWDANGVMQTAAVDEMRIDHDPVTGEPLGVLIEPGRTNIYPYSVINMGDWGGYNLTLSASAGEAPDGSQDATLLMANPTENATQHWVRTNNPASLVFTPDQIYVVSGYIKSAGARRINLFLGGGVPNLDGGSINIDLGAGTYTGTHPHGKLESVGDGWFRFSYLVAPTQSNFSGPAYIQIQGEGGGSTYVADGTEGIYLWGFQVELGTYPTSYIPTNGAAVTRSKDVCRRALGGEYLPSSSTLLLHWLAPGNDDEGYVWTLDSASTADAFIFRYNQTSYRLGGTGLSSYINESDLGGDITEGIVAVSSGVDDLSLVANSTLIDTDTDFLWPGGAVDLCLGGSGADTFQLGGHIKYVTIYPHALSATELEELTS